MRMYNLLQYGDNNSVTSRSLWMYCRDGMNGDVNENNADSYRIDNSKTATSRYFEYKTNIKGNTPADVNRLESEVVVPLNHFEISSFFFD